MLKLNDVVIFGLPNSKKLAQKIVDKLGLKLSDIQIENFSDGETFCRPQVSVRNKRVILIQSTSKPVNESLMTLLITIDALKRASAKEIDLIIPYYAYARQDRKSSGREPITAKLVANLLSTAGASRVMVMDIHSDQIQGFFDVPVDTLKGMWTLLPVLVEKEGLEDMCVVSPDYGGVKRARTISQTLNIPLAIVDKRRPKANSAIAENVLGDVDGKVCLLVDDMIDTGGTIINAARLLKQKGAKRVIALATHGLFSNDSGANFQKAYEDKIIDKIYISDTIESVYEAKIDCLEVISLANFLAEIIKIYINNSGSITELYSVCQNKIKDC